MKVVALIEVMYDKRKPIDGLPDLSPQEVTVLRFGLTDDRVESLETQCQREGQKVLDAAPGAAKGFNHRVVITGFQIDGVPAAPKQPVIVALKSPQPA